MSLPDNSPLPTSLDEINLEPPNSLYPQGTYQAMRYFEGKCQSGIASLSSTGATAFIADKINKTAQLVTDTNVKFLTLEGGGFMYLHGDPFEEGADQSHPSKDRAQSPTIDIHHWGEITSAKGLGVDYGEDGSLDGMEQDLETAGSAHLGALSLVGWCTNCAGHSCLCIPHDNHEISLST